MDRDVIAQKLDSLCRCLQRVTDKCPADPAVLMTDLDAQDIVTFNLTRAIQICVDIGAYLIAGEKIAPPDTMGGIFDSLAETGIIDHELALRLRRAVGFRNIAVHNYRAIDWFIVHTIATAHLKDFSDFVKQITEPGGVE